MILNRYLPLLFMLVSFLNSDGQNNIPNGGFEDWEVRHHYLLDSWYHPNRNVTRTTDSKEGKYALKLENSIAPNGTEYRSYAYNRQISAGLRGFAFTDEVLSLAFWAKYDLPVGDSARILVYMRQNGVTKGYVNFKMYGSTNNNYVKHIVPIYWYNSRTPDTAWIYIYSYTETDLQGPGYVIIDDLHFENIGKRGSDMTNQGFENWTDIGVNHPQEWRSLDLLYLDTYNAFLPERSAFQSADRRHGGSALKVTNYDNNGPQRSYIYIGTENNDYYTPTFPISKRYAYLQGYYKMSSDAPDSALIVYRTWRNGVVLSYNSIYLTPTNKWTHFSIPLTYNKADSFPDSAACIIYSSVGITKSAETALFVDVLELVDELQFLSVEEIPEVMSIYPNPTQDLINLECTEPMRIIIRDAQGKSVLLTETYPGNQTLDLSELQSGVYFMIIENKTSQWQKIIVKQ